MTSPCRISAYSGSSVSLFHGFFFNKIEVFSGEKKNPLLNTTLTLMMASYILSVRSALWDFWSSGLIYRVLGEYVLISSLPGKALGMHVDIARLAERFNMRSQSRAW